MNCWRESARAFAPGPSSTGWERSSTSCRCRASARRSLFARSATPQPDSRGTAIVRRRARVRCWPGRLRNYTGPVARVLIAEDETIIRLDLAEMLARAGFHVCGEARDGVEAVELARSEQPDVAVLDVKMPRLDGIEAARRILDERPIPIVMLTAYGQDELVSRAVEAGVFGYRVKLSEQDAFALLRRASQTSGRPMKVVAEALVSRIGDG